MKTQLSIALIILLPVVSCKSKNMTSSVQSANVISQNSISGTGFYDFETASNQSLTQNVVGEYFSDHHEAEAVRSDMIGNNILPSLSLADSLEAQNLGFFLYVDSRDFKESTDELRGFKTTFLLVNSTEASIKTSWSVLIENYRQLKLSAAGKIEPRKRVSSDEAETLTDTLNDFPWDDLIQEGAGGPSKRVNILRVARVIDPANFNKSMATAASGKVSATVSTGRHILVENLYAAELQKAGSQVWDFNQTGTDQKIYLVAVVRDGDKTIQGMQILAMPNSWMTGESHANTNKSNAVSDTSAQAAFKTSPLPDPQSGIDDVAASIGGIKGSTKVGTRLINGVTALHIRSEPSTKSGRVVGSITHANGGQVNVDTTCVPSEFSYCWFAVSTGQAQGYVYSKYLANGRRVSK